MRLFNVIDLPEFLGCQFQLKVTILQIGFQPCPTFIRVNKCALVRPKIIQQYRETKRKSRPKQKVPLVKRPERSPLTPKTSARPQPASPAAAGARQGCSWRSAWTDDLHRGALRALQELGGAGPPPGISEMPEMSYFHSACAYICYRPHLHSFAGIHPKDLTVLPYFHFANYNYEMWMEVPTMYYAQESNPTNIGKSKRTNPGLRPWQNKKMPLVKRPPGRPPLFIQRPQPRLSQLSPLPQEQRQVVHGGERVRVIRTEVRFAPCKSSAVQGLRLASRRCRRCHTFIQHAPIYAIGLICIHLQEFTRKI